MSLRSLKRRLKATPLHPRYLSNRAIRNALAALAPQARGRLLDVGCGHKPYLPLFRPYITSYTGVDVPVSIHGTESIDAGASALALPFRPDQFETVLATEVMEHVPDPSRMLSEIARVLTPGGALILSVPFHEPLHELPYDFYRYTHIGLAELMQRQGLVVEAVERRGGAVAVLCHLLCSFLYRRFGSTGHPHYTRARPIAGPLVIGVCIVLQLICVALDPLVSDEFDTIGFVVLARKPASLSAAVSPYEHP